MSGCATTGWTWRILAHDDPHVAGGVGAGQGTNRGRSGSTCWQPGGLHVLGTERHEARRIDNQLRGRAGRQGDPGSSRFFISLEDDLMRRFGGQIVAGLMDRLGLEEDMPIEHGLISKAIENAQVRVEGYNFDIRKHVLEYDDVVNKQREVIYEQRLQILTEPTMRPTIWGMIEDEIEALVEQFAGQPGPQRVGPGSACTPRSTRSYRSNPPRSLEHWRQHERRRAARPPGGAGRGRRTTRRRPSWAKRTCASSNGW